MTIHLLRKTRKIRNIDKCLSIKEYAKKHFLCARGVIKRIESGKLVGYKINGCWYVLDHSLCS